MGAGQLFFMLRIYRICCKCSRVNNRVALAAIIIINNHYKPL